MDPVVEVGESFVNGKLQVFPNRIEYHKRTRHGSIPIGEASLSVEGFGFRTIKVHGKSQTFEVENASMRDYRKLQEAISRLQSGESLESGQISREESEHDRRVVKDVAQDDNVQGCGLIVGVGFVLLVILGFIIMAVQWVFNAIGSLF